MKMLLIAAALALAPGLALAKTYPLPPKETVASVDIPETWKAKDLDSGVEGTSADGEVYISVETMKGVDLKAAGDEMVAYLTRKGVKLDDASMVKSDLKGINGMDGVEIDWGSATDKDGPTKISLIMLIPAPEHILVMTYWATPAGETANSADIIAIQKSMKPVR